MIFLSVGMTIAASLYGVPGAFLAVHTIGPAIVNSIPDDFSLTLKNGVASSKSENPVVIAWPDNEAIRKAVNQTEYKNFIVIDTRSDSTSQAFKDSNAMFFIARDSLVSSVNHIIQVMPFTGLPDVVVTKDSFRSLVKESQNSFYWIVFAFVFFTFVRLLFMFTLELLLLILLAVVFWALLSPKRVGTKISFQKAYQFVLHAASLALIYYGLVLVYPFLYVPFLFSVITVIVFWKNVLKDKGAHLRSVHAHAEHAPHDVHSGHHSVDEHHDSHHKKT